MKLPSAFIGRSNQVNVIIETPKNSSNKYTYDHDLELFKLSKILPEGLAFPLHFGFIPKTLGEDGDPLDVLVLMDEPSYPGCLIECRLIGIIQAEQTEDGKTVRNDRIIATALVSKRYTSTKTLNDLDKYLMKEITNFFITYNEMSGKKFNPLKNASAKEAINLIKKSMTDE